MGIPQSVVDSYVRLAQVELAFAPGHSYIDLGSQDVQIGEESEWTSARTLIEGLGLSYDCIDKDGRHGALRLDLNHCKWWHIGKGYEGYDVVANHGTTEHCFDQENCFRLIHDLCKVRGLMIHRVPTNGDKNSIGFFYYSVEFFEDLMYTNGYVLLEPIEIQDDGKERMLNVIMRKVVGGSFIVPTQRMYR